MLAGRYHAAPREPRNRNSVSLKDRSSGVRPGWSMMIRPLLMLAAPMLFLVSAPAQEKYQEPDYPTPPEAALLPGVPEGTIQRFSFTNKEGVYPGTIRRYWVYVPKQCDAAKPAALMVLSLIHI